MALSVAAIVLITLGVIFLLVVIGLIIFSTCYCSRRYQERKLRKSNYYVRKNLDDPVIPGLKVENGFSNHATSNGTAKPAANGQISASHNIDRKKQSAQQVSLSKSTARSNRQNQHFIPVHVVKPSYDEVDSGRPAQHGYHHHGGTLVRAPPYVYIPPSRGTRHNPVYVVSQRGAHSDHRRTVKPKPQTVRTQNVTHTRKLDRNWNLGPKVVTSQQQYQHQQQTQKFVKLDKYQPRHIAHPPKPVRQISDILKDKYSVDDEDGRALYLRWSPSLARRKQKKASEAHADDLRESSNIRSGDYYRRDNVHHENGFLHDDLPHDRERPPSGGSFKIATNTLPLPRGKTGLPSPIPSSNQHQNKTQM